MKKILFIAALCMGYVAFAAAQNLDKIQTKSAWGAHYQRADLDNTYKFEAFNPATEIYYTISNNNNKLYLQVQVQNPEVIEKAIKGGIKFTVSAAKNSAENMVIKYPVMSRDDKIMLKTGYKPTSDNTETKKLQIDSFIRDANKKISAASKTIKLSYGKAKPDTVSIYNDKGIEVLSFLDHNLYYNYQLTIPLNLLSAVNNKDSFSYAIALTGLQFGEFSREITSRITSVTVNNGHVEIGGPDADKIILLTNKTDLSGEYKLAKK